MAKLEIKLDGDPVLRRKTKAVVAVDKKVQRLLDDMLETMYAAPGVGLAAPQIGISKRLVVVDVGEDESSQGPLKLVNPKIVAHGDQEELSPEGCLSFPGLVGDVWRNTKVTVRALNEVGEPVKIEAKGFLARALQHEIDHLDGICYVDLAENVRTTEQYEKELEAAQAEYEAEQNGATPADETQS